MTLPGRRSVMASMNAGPSPSPMLPGPFLCVSMGSKTRRGDGGGHTGGATGEDDNDLVALALDQIIAGINRAALEGGLGGDRRAGVGLGIGEEGLEAVDDGGVEVEVDGGVVV